MSQNLAYLTSQYPAPSHTFIRREVEALRRRGVSVQTFSVRPPRVEERMSDVDETEFERTWYSFPVKPARLLRSHLAAFFGHPFRYFSAFRLALTHRVPGLRAFIWALFHFVEAIELAEALRARGVTHLHNHFANSAANVGVVASQFLGIPWSVTLHGISEFDYPAGVLLADKIRLATQVACVSHFGRSQAMRIVETEHWSKMFIARCGVELALFPKVPVSDRARPRVLSVGRLSPEKGYFGLLDAFLQAQESGLDADLAILGDGPQMAAIKARIEELGLGARVTLLGRLNESDVLVEMARSDLFVSASLMEGLPVVLMEALGLGVPVIAPRVAGIPELVEEGQTGWLFSPGHWVELAAAMSQALASPELRRAYGRQGQARVVAEFDIDRAVLPLLARFAPEGIEAVDAPSAQESAAAE